MVSKIFAKKTVAPNRTNRLIGAVLALCLSVSGVSEGMSTDEAQAKAAKLYKLLNNGLPLLKTNPLYQQIVDAVATGSVSMAADIITNPKSGAASFYNNAIASLPQTINRPGTPVGNRGEISALFVGYARDELKFSEMFSVDRTYYDPTIGTNANKYEINIEEHYKYVWESQNPRDSLKALPRPGGITGVGIFTTNQWGLAFWENGTSRRNWGVGILENLYCLKQDRVRSTIIPDSYVARDVPRTPGNDPVQYLKNCKSCHAQMDALRPAFLAYTWNGARLVAVAPGSANFDRIASGEANNYPSGYKPVDDSWNLFVSEEQNALLGLKEVDGLSFQNYGGDVKMMSGKGLAQFGKVIGNSTGLYRCMVRRIVSQVYLGKVFGLSTLAAGEIALLDSQNDVIDRFAGEFAQHQSLRKAYQDVALYYFEAIQE